MDIVEEFSDAVAILRANSYERTCLWREYHEKQGHPWKDVNHGSLITVGYISNNRNRPVCISIFSFIFEGRRVVTIEDTSRYVDHTMIDQWLAKNFPNIDRYNHTDANNFHNVRTMIVRLNEGEAK